MNIFHHFAKRKNLLNKLRDDSGAMVVEFALVAPVFLIFTIGVIDFGRAYWVKSTMQFAVEQTARFAMVNPSASLVTLHSKAVAEGGTVSGATYTVTASTASGMNFITVQGSYPFSFLIPIIPMGDVTLTAKSSTPISKI